MNVYLLVCDIKKNAFSRGNGFAVVLMLTSDSRRGRAVVTGSWLYSFRFSKYVIWVKYFCLFWFLFWDFDN